MEMKRNQVEIEWIHNNSTSFYENGLGIQWVSHNSVAEDRNHLTCYTVSLSTVPSVLKTPWSFRMWGTVYPKAQCNIPGQ